MPNTSSPLVSGDGKMQQPWVYWFQSFGQQNEPIGLPIVEPSPMVYTANRAGMLSIEGGTVSLVEFKRGIETVTFPTAGVFLMAQNDVIEITYSVAPNLRFIPI